MSEQKAAPAAKPRLRGLRSGRAPSKSTAVVARGAEGGRSRVASQVPPEILHDAELNEALRQLPDNYDFEVHKTVWRLRAAKSTRVALQFPEGLLLYACVISDILERFAGVETLIMGDVTYGACCIDDLSARAAGCDFLVHYGHSCLVPVDVGELATLYVFVRVGIDVPHLVHTLRHNFAPDTRLVLAGTVQFTAAVQSARTQLKSAFASLDVPQARPLSPGEVLGCTSPRLQGPCDALVFVADGRFHLESIMIHNPHVAAFYKYDPYSKRLTLEQYGHDEMRAVRSSAIEAARGARKWGLILGTLGRQGNPNIIARLERLLAERGRERVVVLLSEIFPAKLALLPDVDAWVQVACPRLSVDWGYAFDRPLLSPYEAEVALGAAHWAPVYPMDYYAKAGGPWSNYAVRDAERAAAALPHPPAAATAAGPAPAGPAPPTSA